MIRTVVVDDEPPAIERIEALVASAPDFEIVGRFGSATQASRMLPKLAPQAAFIDIQMPRMNGFEVIRRLQDTGRTAVVFVTGHEQFAVEAFSIDAVDYLLKPFDDVRFARALERVRLHLRRQEVSAAAAATAGPYTRRVAVVAAACITLVAVDEIDWLEAAGNYVRLHCRRERHLVRESLTSLISRLDPREFVRVHRSTAVKLDRVRSIQSSFGRESVITLRDGTRIRMSASHREDFERVIGLKQSMS